MNHIRACITEIETSERIAVVSFEASGQPLKMMALTLPVSCDVGQEVLLGVKASHISLGKGIGGMLSVANQLEVTVEEVTYGDLLTEVRFRLGVDVLESIITTDSAQRMQLKEGASVIALIKASELSIVKGMT